MILAVYLRALVAPVYLVALAALAPLAVARARGRLLPGRAGRAGDHLLRAAGRRRAADRARLGLQHLPRRPDLERGEQHAAAGGDRRRRRAVPRTRSPRPGSCSPPRSPRWRSCRVDAFQQLAFVLAVGLLIDAFLVRSMLTPAVIALVGERSSWPGDRLAAPARAQLPPPGARLTSNRCRAGPSAKPMTLFPALRLRSASDAAPGRSGSRTPCARAAASPRAGRSCRAARPRRSRASRPARTARSSASSLIRCSAANVARASSSVSASASSSRGDAQLGRRRRRAPTARSAAAPRRSVAAAARRVAARTGRPPRAARSVAPPSAR